MRGLHASGPRPGIPSRLITAHRLAIRLQPLSLVPTRPPTQQPTGNPHRLHSREPRDGGASLHVSRKIFCHPGPFGVMGPPLACDRS